MALNVPQGSILVALDHSTHCVIVRSRAMEWSILLSIPNLPTLFGSAQGRPNMHKWQPPAGGALVALA